MHKVKKTLVSSARFLGHCIVLPCRSMLAYSGKYLFEGNHFVTTVDVSWNEEWNGTEQRRHFRLEGDKLFIESAPGPSILFPGKVDFRRIVWQREK